MKTKCYFDNKFGVVRIVACNSVGKRTVTATPLIMTEKLKNKIKNYKMQD